MVMLSAAWSNSRPWRNRNPGDLRCLPGIEKWYGQASADNSPGGPFAIFDSRTNGWRSLATCLITYWRPAPYGHNLKTVQGIANRFAPPTENDTSSYAKLLAAHLNVGLDAPINLLNPTTLVILLEAIALAEGGARLPWDASERNAGAIAALQASGLLSPHPNPKPPSGPPSPSADDLMQQELDRLHEENE